MLKFAILELLHRKPLSGYELKRRFQGSIVFFWRANHSQIYLELQRMEKAGLVVSNQVPQDRRPTKKVYAVTTKGLQALVRWLREKPKLQSVKDEMLLKCFAFNLIAPDEAAAQFVHHRKLHEARLSHYLGIKQQLDARHGDLLKTSDPILFWNFLCLRQAIAFERMYIGWCQWALARHRDFTDKERSTSLDAGEQAAGEQADGRLAN
jgi:DNA-binding PadR family transcriptional regulator